MVQRNGRNHKLILIKECGNDFVFGNKLNKKNKHLLIVIVLPKVVFFHK